MGCARRGGWGWVLACCAAAWAATARGADPAGASAWVSSDAAIYLELPRPAALLDLASDERFRALLEGVPGLREALRRPEVAQLRRVVDEVSRRLGKPWDVAARELAGGGAVLAVEVPRGRAPGLALVVTPTDPAAPAKAIDALRELAREEATGRGAEDPIATGEHRGVVGYAIKGQQASYAIVEDRLVIADRPETLKAVVDRSLDGLPAGRRIESVDAWKGRKWAVTPETLAWGLARLDLLREVDPNRFRMDETPDAGGVLLLGGWLETLRRAPWVAAAVSWTDARLAGELVMPAPAGVGSGPFRGYIPPRGEGAPAPLNPPGTILSVGLWRDLAAVWEAKAEIFRPEDAQNLNQLDGVAGTFFGGRDFGGGVLGALAADWRLVVALQDPATLSPAPDVKLPAFALVARLKAGDDDFAQRLRVAFQSFVGLANLGAAQTKAPPLELLSETHEGVTLSTTRFMAPSKGQPPGVDPEPVHYRHNFSPTAAQVGPHFVLSSSVGLARDLVSALKGGGEAPREEATLAATADGAALARLVEVNHRRLVMQNILEKGNDEDRAKAEVDLLAALLRYLGRARLGVVDGEDLWRLDLEFQLGR